MTVLESGPPNRVNTTIPRTNRCLKYYPIIISSSVLFCTSIIADSRDAGLLDDVLPFAQTINLALIEAPRALPVLEENDYFRFALG